MLNYTSFYWQKNREILINSIQLEFLLMTIIKKKKKKIYSSNKRH